MSDHDELIARLRDAIDMETGEAPNALAVEAAEALERVTRELAAANRLIGLNTETIIDLSEQAGRADRLEKALRLTTDALENDASPDCCTDDCCDNCERHRSAYARCEEAIAAGRTALDPGGPSNEQ